MEYYIIRYERDMNGISMEWYEWNIGYPLGIKRG